MTIRQTFALLASAAGLAAPLAAHANPAVALDSAVFVERIAPGMGRMLQPAATLHSGDRVVYVVSWSKMG